MTGVYTLRGYNEREFKGERFLVFNTEYRYILDENIIGIAFVDVGDAWDREDPLSLSYFKIGAGLGLHINIAFGPLRLPMRLDYGFGKKEGGMFHFRLGFLF